jgi:Mn2+/Fe2+ NRAMP family transporter
VPDPQTPASGATAKGATNVWDFLVVAAVMVVLVVLVVYLAKHYSDSKDTIAVLSTVTPVLGAVFGVALGAAGGNAVGKATGKEQARKEASDKVNATADKLEAQLSGTTTQQEGRGEAATPDARHAVATMRALADGLR